jgi:predicted transcriptional regulator
MARTRTTICLDPDVLRAMQVVAARAGKRDSDVVEEALRRYLGLALLDQVWVRDDLGEEEALQLAY